MTRFARFRSLPARGLPAGLLVSLLLGLAASPASAVSIVIHTTDGPAEGFNDPTAVAPVGGNPGTTLGAQRLFLFQHAAEVWGLRLGGNLPIVVSASFAPLSGTAVSATLGFARPTTVHRDFLGAPTAQTWYVAGVANQLYGTDQNDFFPNDCPIPLATGKCPEIETQFNSDVDGPIVLGPLGFYYGIDGNSGSNIDFLTVLLHEIGHGLGVVTLTNTTTGERFFGYSDAYANRLEDAFLKFPLMTNAQRVAAMRGDKLVLKGPAIIAASGKLNAGVRADGAVQAYAPTTFEAGSSVSHVDTDAAPNELMEPFITNPPPRNLDFTLALLKDLAWTTLAVAKCGDANDDKNLTTTDALIVLKGSVGSEECPRHVCDVNAANGVTTTDALLVLKRAVGQSIAFSCPLA